MAGNVLNDDRRENNSKKGQRVGLVKEPEHVYVE